MAVVGVQFVDWVLPGGVQIRIDTDRCKTVRDRSHDSVRSTRLLMKLSVQLHLAGLSLANTVPFLEVFGVERARSTIYNWVHKAELQPEFGRSPNHVAVDETVTWIDDEQYWLYPAVDPESNELLHTKPETTRTNALVEMFFRELREKHDGDDAVFLVDDATPLKEACRRHSLDLRYERHGNRNSVERVFREVK